MKRITAKFLLTLMMGSAIVVSCKKEDSPVTPTDSLVGNFKVTGVTQTDESGTWDIFDDIEDCAKDDILSIKKDKSYLYSDNGVQCDPVGTDAGDWHRVGTDSLFIDDATVYIASVNAQQLVLVKAVDFFGSIDTVRITYARQ